MGWIQLSLFLNKGRREPAWSKDEASGDKSKSAIGITGGIRQAAMYFSKTRP
jgi:hypothetical protein